MLRLPTFEEFVGGAYSVFGWVWGGCNGGGERRTTFMGFQRGNKPKRLLLAF